MITTTPPRSSEQVAEYFKPHPIDGGPGQGIPDYGDLIREANERVARRTPSYRGAATIPDIGNTGVITTNQGVAIQVYPGDYVIFTGEQQGIWEYANIYEWNGEKWAKLGRKQNAWKVMAGIGDLTKGAPDGVFAEVFCQALWAQQAFIQELQTRLIILMEGGAIQSENYSPGVSGFFIKANGDCEFNDGKFRGHIEADSGSIGDVLFAGSIISGPLQLLDDTPVSELIEYGAGTTAKTLYEAYGGGFSVIGSYNNQQITHLAVVKTFLVSGSFGANNMTFHDYFLAFVIHEDASQELIAVYTMHPNPGAVGVTPFNLHSLLSFRITGGGKTLRLTDLPVADPHSVGAVWRNNNQLMISTG
jgi:hypothetical protein